MSANSRIQSNVPILSEKTTQKQLRRANSSLLDPKRDWRCGYFVF
uniref:AlNc14C18G1876 protein n=1 Tax=Albugo laibachii Nc14 TaxID=890382 RepID=F0W4Q5_9STRA|nr:AlNc14C18G1876 [Albugo laibachii Nc14]|eukprot:CCA16090.1 AlNc14C18G1876 [Albugo laibachii Nc14]